MVSDDNKKTCAHGHPCREAGWDDAGAILRRARLRRTAGREAILGVLVAAKRPMSEEEVAQELGDTRLNKVTIYRALDGFERAGVVHRVFLRGRTRHYELADRCTQVQCHPHFTCTQCERTYCLEDVEVPLARGLGAGWELERQQVRLEGRCPECSGAERQQ